MTGLSFMGFVALCLLGIGVLVSLVGSVMMLIAAFRQHIGWGVASLVVPGASLVFTVLHWAEARRGFLLQIAGGVAIALGVLAANDAGSTPRALVSSEPAQDAADTDTALRTTESRVRVVEQEVTDLQAKLLADYASLKARRESLGSDPAVLAAFNSDAAAYDKAKLVLSVKTGKLAQLRADQLRLTDQFFLAAREKAKANPNAVVAPVAPVVARAEPAKAATPKPLSVSAGDVVMYTTRTCPACIAAKQYFARRGVPYKEVDVQSDRDGRAAFEKLGGNAVPLILVKGQRMVGFNQRELEKLL